MGGIKGPRSLGAPALSRESARERDLEAETLRMSCSSWDGQETYCLEKETDYVLTPGVYEKYSTFECKYY